MATAEKRVVTDATGQAILAELRKIPGVMNPVPIEKGGTGASTPEEAREAIGAQEKLGFNVSEELNKRVKSVNEILPDENGNVQIIRVPMADNFTSDESHIVSGTFIERTTGGDASVTDGNAYLGVLYGNSVRSGYTAETKNFETRLAERTDDSQPMTAEINWNTFREAVGGISTNKTFSYTTTWNENPETYGIVVGGTPKNGDVINVYFIAENRGVIANATPETFNSTNWNLYDNETGYAKVLKYSDIHGFKIGGTYTGVSFSATVDGDKTVITPDSNGLFTVPSDGYVFVTGGNNTDTYVLMTWSDWEDGYTGDFLTKNVSTIDFSEVMENVFPFGLCAIGIVTDEINFNDRVATVRIERIAYSTENRIVAENSGRNFIYDANWIYSVKETPEKVRFNIDNDLVVYDHGIEYFTGTEVPLTAFELFGQNLKDKLRREVVAVTPQNFSASQKQIARENIEAAWNSEVIKSINNKVPDANGNITIVEGQSNASYGSYRIDPVIPPAAWSLVNGQYQVAYSDPLIKATMTGSETWLDNNDAMLGKTTFNTIDGALLIVTAVQPTETWRLHVLLAENGATVLEEVHNKVDESDLAIVETEDTAFHNITAGQYVMWKGEMYKATAAIASGATLSATGTGANLAAVSNGVANELNSNLQTQISSLNSDISQFMHVPTETYDGDLNSLRTPGWYLIGTNATNTPPQINGGKLKVEESSTSNYTRQTFYCGYTYHIYTRARYYYNNGWRWTSWQEVTNESLNNNVEKLNSNVNTTSDVLASALSCTRTTFFNGNGGGYTGSLPSGAENSFRWSTFMVNVKGTIKTVIALSPENKMYTNIYDNEAWSGWEALAKSKNIVKSIASEADLNTITEPGFYNFAAAGTLVNAPVEGTNRLGLIVQRSESNLYVMQFAFENLQNNYGVYFRRNLNGTWSSWNKVAFDSNKVDKSDIVNNLTTNDSTKVLSAAQGYALNSNIICTGQFELLNSSIAQSSDTSWHNASGSITIPANAKYLVLNVEPNGAMRQSLVVPVIMLRQSSLDYYVNNYWDSNNFGYLRIDRNGNYYVGAKTQSMKFNYSIHEIH